MTDALTVQTSETKVSINQKKNLTAMAWRLARKVFTPVEGGFLTWKK